MNEIQKTFQNMTKSQTYTELARLSGISRNTIYNVRKNPERATLGTIRKIFRAMGYEVVIRLEKS
jgi:DNA-binding phage protein